MAGPGDLQLLCEEFLAACAEALNTIPSFEPGLGGAPARSFTPPPGQVPYDCCPDGQLTVNVAAVNSLPVEPIKNHVRQNMVTLQATILRCVPASDEDGGPVDALESQAAGEQVNADGWALWNHIFSLVSAGELFRLCDPVIWNGMRPAGPSGGCGGWVLTVSMPLDGYDDVPSS